MTQPAVQPDPAVPLAWPCLVMLLAAALLLGGCGRESQSQKVVKQIASWSETAQMTAEQVLRGAVPRAYARRTVNESRQKIGQLRRQLGNEEQQAALRDALEAHTDEILAALGSLQAAIERGDEDTARQQIHRLASAEDALKRTGETASPQ